MSGTVKTRKEDSILVSGFCTKYALTKGIEPAVIDVGRCGKEPGDYVYTVERFRRQLVWGKTFFVDLNDAKMNAKHQANNAIRSCKLKLAKLEKLAECPKVVAND